ncbi:MAG: phosphatase PAP2 family protein [Bacteroidota bacterium]|nr:phosphatase PAP2 family protein [Bacteroidota bacterium]
MKQLVLLSVGIFGILNITIAQDSMNISSSTMSHTQISSFPPVRYPYKTTFKKDAPVIIVASGLAYIGNNLIKHKAPLTQAELATKTEDKIPFFDRGNAGYYDNNLNKVSYIPMLGSFPLPLIMILANKNERRNASQILVMYLETEAITAGLYTMVNGSTNRPRPLVYGTTAPIGERLNKNNQRSFYAGHTASSASATFFAAKVFSDLNPDSKAKPYVWVVAAAIPAVVGYMRYQSGFHFLSDNILGYAIGAATGILVPQWHKKKHDNVSFAPEIGNGYRGIAVTYHLK